MEKRAHDWELWQKRELNKSVAQNRALFHTQQPSSVFAGTEERQESIDVKWLKRPGRGRKVEEGTPASVTLNVAKPIT